MERFVKGDVVVLPFPFSDLSSTKKRPALIVANLIGDDMILCQITSADRKDSYSILLNKEDFKIGKLSIDSVIRPNRLFTADSSIIAYKIGAIKDKKLKEIEDRLISIFRA